MLDRVPRIPLSSVSDFSIRQILAKEERRSGVRVLARSGIASERD